MRLRIIASAGWYDVRNDVAYKPGDVIDIDGDRAAKFIRNSIAEPVPESPQVETAAVEPPKNAAKRTTKPKPRKAVT